MCIGCNASNATYTYTYNNTYTNKNTNKNNITYIYTGGDAAFAESPRVGFRYIYFFIFFFLFPSGVSGFNVVDLSGKNRYNRGKYFPERMP